MHLAGNGTLDERSDKNGQEKIGGQNDQSSRGQKVEGETPPTMRPRGRA